MNSQRAQQLIYAGYGKAALRLGPLNTVYRPSSSLNPITNANAIATLPASFNAENMEYTKPRGYGKATWYCLVDGRQTKVGDYLVDANGITYFIAAQQLLLPILAVLCTRSVRIGRMETTNTPGFAGYSGVVQSVTKDVLGTSDGAGGFVSGWPASILVVGKHDKEPILPSSTKQGGVVILLPITVPIEIQATDVVMDDLGREYTISAAEITALGWRLQANEVHP